MYHLVYNTLMKTETRGRPKTFDEIEALTAAMHYFWENGYDNTSLDNLLETMNIKKSSFYATFKSKEAIFSRCLALYRESMSTQLRNLNKEIGSKQTLLMLTNMTIAELTRDRRKLLTNPILTSALFTPGKEAARGRLT